MDSVEVPELILDDKEGDCHQGVCPFCVLEFEFSSYAFFLCSLNASEFGFVFQLMLL